MVPAIPTAADYDAAMTAQYPAYAAQLLAHYPASSFGTPRQTMIRVTTDISWTCPTRRMLRALAANQTQPVYRYFFTWQAPGATGAIIGAAHALELPFVFHSFSAIAGYVPDATATALSDAIEGYWSRFAAGDPNGAGAVPWPRYDAATDPALELGPTIAPLTPVRAADCDFLETLFP